MLAIRIFLLFSTKFAIINFFSIIILNSRNIERYVIDTNYHLLIAEPYELLGKIDYPKFPVLAKSITLTSETLLSAVIK